MKSRIKSQRRLVYLVSDTGAVKQSDSEQEAGEKFKGNRTFLRKRLKDEDRRSWWQLSM